MNSIIKQQEEFIVSFVLGISIFAILMWNLLQRTYEINENFTIIGNRYIYSMFIFTLVRYMTDLIREITFFVRVNNACFESLYNNYKLIIVMTICCILSIIGSIIAFNNDQLILGYIILFTAYNLFPKFFTNGIYTSNEGIIVSNVFVSKNVIGQTKRFKKNKYEITDDKDKISIKIYDKKKRNWVNDYIAISRSTI